MDTDLNLSGIYAIKNTLNGKNYVGQSQNIANRIEQHKQKNNHCVRLRNAINYYGWNAFEVSVLEQITDLSKLNEREQYWIDALDVCNREKGYNLCPIAGSSRGIRYSDEVRAKMSAANRSGVAEVRAKNSKTHTGVHFSKERCIKSGLAHKNPSIETRAKIGAAHKGRIFSDKHRSNLSAAGKGKPRNPTSGRPPKPIFQLDVNTGTIIKRWESISDAGRGTKISISAICGCCRGRQKSAGGFLWQYVCQDF